MSDSDGGDDTFTARRREIISGIERMHLTTGDLTREVQRLNLAAETNHVRVVGRLDAVETWKAEVERWRYDKLEARLREVETTRTQALVIAGLGSVIFGVIIAVLARVLVH